MEQREEYLYDELSNLTGIREGGVIYGYEYDKAGKLLKETNPVTNIDRSYSYYKSGKVKSVVTDKTGKDPAAVDAIDRAYYEYDKLGNITYKEENSDKYSYSYDMLGRLEYSTMNDYHTDYEYDKFGNISSETKYKTKAETPDRMQAYSKTKYKYDSGNRLIFMDYTEGSRDFDIQKQSYLEYDDEGNLIEKKENQRNENMGNLGTSIQRYEYNGFNQTSGYIGTKGTYKYYYNAQGLRSRKVKTAEAGASTGASDVINYYYNGGNIVLETDGENQTTAKTLHGLHLIKRETKGSLPAGIQTAADMANADVQTASIQSQATSEAGATAGETMAMANTNGFITYYYLQNSNGDVTKLLDSDGKVIKDYKYEPFGEEIKETGNNFGDNFFQSKWREEVEGDDSLNNPYRFSGQYCDSESGNYYLRARYYDPSIQRFTQEDTYSGRLANPASLNLYAYCNNNPVNFVDPSGNKTVKVQSNGKAPKGLSRGDIVKTAGGNFKITSVKSDGSYTSSKVTGSNKSSGSNKNNNTSKSTNNAGTKVSITLPGGKTATGTIKDGKTYMSDGSRVPVGTIVSTGSGKFVMGANGGTKLSPANNLNTPGTLTSFTGTVINAGAKVGKEVLPTAIANTPKPNNIGSGTWNKAISQDISKATSDMNKVAKFGNGLAGIGIGVDIGSSIYQDYTAGEPASKIAYDAAVTGGIGLGGVGAAKGGELLGAFIGSAGGPMGTVCGEVVGGVAGTAYYAYKIDVATYEKLGNKETVKKSL